MRKILEIKMQKEPCNSIFQILDLYNKDFPLRIFGKERYTTKAGSVLGMISIIAIISFSLFFLLELFARKTLMVVYNKNSNILPFVDLTNALFMVAVTDKTGKLLPLQGVYNLEIKMLNYYMDKEKKVTAFNSTNIDFEICNIEKHNKTYGDVFKDIQYNAFHCVEPGHQNKSLYGKLGDFPNGFSLLGVYIKRCDPKRQECLDESVIDKYLSDFVLGITYSSYSVDHYNYRTPNTRKYENNGVFPMSYSLLKCYFYNLAQVIYETDYGLIFEEKKQIDFYEFESQTVDINMPGTITNSIFAPESTVGYILFKCSENISYFNRSYGKAQAVIANIGGLIKAMLVLTKLMFDFFTRKSILVDLANTFFEFSDSEDETNRNFHFRKSNSNIDENFNRNNKDFNKSLSEKNEIIIKNINKNKSEKYFQF